MKALIVAALSGFISAFLQNDIKTLQDMGYEVHCAADAGHANTTVRSSIWDELNVTFHQVDFDSKNPASKKNLEAYKEISSLAKQEQFDLVHCHTPIAGFITRLAMQSYRKKGMKVIYTSHGFYFHKHAPKKDWVKFYPIEKVASHWCDAIVTINNEDLQCAKGMWCKRCYKINSIGLDVDRYLNTHIDREAYRASIGIEKDDVMVLAVGELSERKNHAVIIKALGKIGNPKYKFVICGRAATGTGTYDKLKALAQELRVPVIFLGYRNDMPEIYKCTDITVLPSKREGLGMAGLQSLISGVPVVGSDVHGIVDYVIEGKTGYRYNPDDVDGFAKGIRKLSDRNARESMRENCIKTAMCFSKEISKEQMKKIYEDVLGGKNSVQ